jgi:hypothetical protein
MIVTDTALAMQFSVNTPKTITYMYVPAEWKVDQTFRAFADKAEVVSNEDDFKECISQGKNRIFVINSSECERMVEETGLYELERRDNMVQSYYSCNFDIAVYKLK